jgi:RimJ/RimL family protein N-acetyltransferase
MPPAIDLKTAPSMLTRARVRLETPRADHAPAFAESLRASLPGFTYLSWGARATQDGWALRFCVDDARSVAAGEDLVFHAFEIDTGAYVGRLDVHSIDVENARAELGYVGDARRAAPAAA